MKIFIDDERIPVDDGWLVVRSYAEFCRAFLGGGTCVRELSFDHDLGGFDPTGLDCVNWLIETALDDPDLVSGLERIYFHTANIIGMVDMRGKLENAQEHGIIGTDIELVDKSCLFHSDHAVMPAGQEEY